MLLDWISVLVLARATNQVVPPRMSLSDSRKNVKLVLYQLGLTRKDLEHWSITKQGGGWWVCISMLFLIMTPILQQFSVQGNLPLYYRNQMEEIKISKIIILSWIRSMNKRVTAAKGVAPSPSSGSANLPNHSRYVVILPPASIIFKSGLSSLTVGLNS